MIKRIIPKDYRPLIDYISPKAFQVIDWKKSIAQIVKISKQSLNPSFVSRTKKTITPLLHPEVKFRDSLESSSRDLTNNKKISELVLDTYFAQFFSDSGSFLDLRLKHFSLGEPELSWYPGPFIHSFGLDFRKGMISIYEGYYFDRPDQMRSGMIAVGLIGDQNDQDVAEITELLFSHFGDADSESVKFELDQFKQSFHELFQFLIKKKIRLPSDFFFLGLYLVTLYFSLSELDSQVNVKDCFLRVWQRNTKNL